MLKCGICKKEFPEKYLGGIRDTTSWGNFIICGRCYNKGHDNLKERVEVVRK
jgi:hypothetical protein